MNTLVIFSGLPGTGKSTLANRLARELQVPLPVTALVHELFGASVALGHGEKDFASAITLLEQFAGVEVSDEGCTAPADHPKD